MASEIVFTLFTTVSTISPSQHVSLHAEQSCCGCCLYTIQTLMCQTWHKPISCQLQRLSNKTPLVLFGIFMSSAYKYTSLTLSLLYYSSALMVALGHRTLIQSWILNLPHSTHRFWKVVWCPLFDLEPCKYERKYQICK